jgi:hypothetical protein
VKTLSALILLFAFSLQTFYTAGVTVWFFANQKILAKNHCVNKARPQLKCDGKCFLAKKIREAEQKEEKQAPFQVKWVETAPCTLAYLHYKLDPVITKTITGYDVADHYSFRFLRFIFHPPAIC